MKLSIQSFLTFHLATSLALTDTDADRPDKMLRGTEASNGSVTDLPNVEQMTYSVNLLLGRTPSEQRHDLVGSKIFELEKQLDSESTKGYSQYEQFSDMSTVPTCDFKGISNNVWYASSRSSLFAQSSTSKHGWDEAWDIGIEVPVKGAKVSAGATIKRAIVFGNSESSKTASEQQNSGRTYSFDAQSSRSIYSVEVDYANMNTWTQGFLEACSKLGEEPTLEDVQKFFVQQGTHGLARATFGQTCKSSVFMEEGQTQAAYFNMLSEQDSYNSDLLFWTSSGSTSMVSLEGASNRHGFQYSIADRRCEGEIATDSSCGAGMKGIGDDDKPAIIEWTYKPIWEMDVPKLSQGAKRKLRETFELALEASVECMEEHCSGQGVCASSGKVMGEWFADLFDGSRCFCLDGFEGSSCEKGRPLRLSGPILDSGWANNLDQELDFSKDNSPICGVQSQHDDCGSYSSSSSSDECESGSGDGSTQDRLFKFRTCPVRESGTDFDMPTGFQQTGESNWDAEMTLLCEENKVMTRLQSYHSNRHEDRRWKATCTHFKNTKTGSCSGFDIHNPRKGAYENKYGGKHNRRGWLDFTCPPGKVLTGLHSVHNNFYEDRIFKFRCCELQVANLY